MPDTRLLIRSPGQPELELELRGTVTIGRAFDNVICIDDSRVSRYHAIIEQRGNEFWLSELGSRNGTTVNGEPVRADHILADGDLISIGNAGTVEFHRNGSGPPSREDGKTALPIEPLPQLPLPSAGAAPVPGPSSKLLIAGIAGGLLIVAVVVLLLSGVIGTSSAPTVRIVSPQTGSAVRGPETIRVEATEVKKIERVIYLLDGVEFASAAFPPFDAPLDPAELDSVLRRTGSGNHILTATIEDKDGNKKPQVDTVVLSFEAAMTGAGNGDVTDVGGGSSDGGTSLPPVDIAALCRNLAAQISGKSWYTFDEEFAEQVRLRTNEYRINFVDDARLYRREIGNAFSAKGLPLPLGFVTAASQSRFKQAAAGADESGFWRVSTKIAVEQGYVTRQEAAAALNDPKRSAEIAAAYMKELVNVFGMDDFMFAIACYGMPISEAAQVRTRLEEVDPGGTARRSFWRVLKSTGTSPKGSDCVTRFFAAGIVGENPRLFGLNAEPLSSLY